MNEHKECILQVLGLVQFQGFLKNIPVINTTLIHSMQKQLGTILRNG